jgi:hypothetical protein
MLFKIKTCKKVGCCSLLLETLDVLSNLQPFRYIFAWVFHAVDDFTFQPSSRLDEIPNVEYFGKC